MNKRRVHLIIWLGILLCSMTVANAKDIYLVRHFEKQKATEQSGNDVHLTDIGKANAQKLAQWMQNKNLAHLFSTDYIRTKQSIAPTVSATLLSVNLYDPRNLESFALQLHNLPGNVLVLGHSNTTGVLFGLLGCEEVKLSESDYGDIFKVSIKLSSDANELIDMQASSCDRYRLNKE